MFRPGRIALGLFPLLSACGGTSSTDTGVADASASAPTADAGTKANDSGSPATDAGPNPPDAGSATEADAGAPATTADAGTPITAPPDTWTWVDVPGSVCLDGSPTGIGVNLVNDSPDVLVFLEGCNSHPDADLRVIGGFYGRK